MLVIPQKAPELHVADVTAYREAYERIGASAPAPIFQGMYFVDEDPVRAREEGRRQFDLHYDAIIDHYEFRGSHFANNKDNKAYASLQKLISTPEGEKSWKDAMFPIIRGHAQAGSRSDLDQRWVRRRAFRRGASLRLDVDGRGGAQSASVCREGAARAQG
jgi:hypothetical protein